VGVLTHRENRLSDEAKFSWGADPIILRTSVARKTNLVMRLYFRAGSGPVLPQETKVSGETEFSWGTTINSRGARNAASAQT